MQVMQETVTALQATVNRHDDKIQQCTKITNNRDTFADAAATIRDSWRPEAMAAGITPFPSLTNGSSVNQQSSGKGSRPGTPYRSQDEGSDQFTFVASNGGKRPLKGSNPTFSGQAAGNKPKQRSATGTAKSGMFKVGPSHFKCS